MVPLADPSGLCHALWVGWVASASSRSTDLRRTVAFRETRVIEVLKI